MRAVLIGMSVMGFVVAAMFFWRFWRRTGDLLFVAFSAAFLLLALNQFLLGLSSVAREDEYLLYLLRVAAFAILIGAIVMKNVGKKQSDEP
jgi:hypothetical protein